MKSVFSTNMRFLIINDACITSITVDIFSVISDATKSTFITMEIISFDSIITPRSSLENPVFENWFISAPPNNKVIKMWIEEVLIALSSQKEYIDKSSDYSKKHIKNPYYHICHLALKNIYEKNKSLFNGAKIYVSNDTAFYYQRTTPDLKYLFKNKFDKKKADDKIDKKT